MSQPTILDRIRDWIGTVAFAIYLWSDRMTKEEFWAEQDRQARDLLLQEGWIQEPISTSFADPKPAKEDAGAS